MTQFSRRDFIAMTAAGALARRAEPFAIGREGGAVTAQDVIDRIKKNLGVEWKVETVDTFGPRRLGRAGHAGDGAVDQVVHA